ncbi:MAG: type II toxin-antitoxin system HicB family antitoxin [Caldilineae bacterium]|nr:type II toxin-antitoxin system HicB family antitoxin [Anaerolineae bacterium]MCB0202755.1 type II toxin-antitoxin system HicB family antitoxin [Anaerolineae bacterium]MCB0205109.1 type II toxin-antitoxin system HicB family antitoxin [Anaerolineae bacterium]MCB0256633.1 type II toxin-antitoxin system HicB family antitoxin [Anaerolineae bacterium]MCB9153471.1 type II toxin-antitoxin system HicB family antitoxin [Caldilineae bacterium]
MRDLSQYPFEIHPLAPEDGGGYLIMFPDFSECISDGETPDEAISNGMDALEETIAALEDLGLPAPEPRSGGSYSGRFVQRVPKSLHARLAARARQEGVSMNALVTTMLAEGLGIHDQHR